MTFKGTCEEFAIINTKPKPSLGISKVMIFYSFNGFKITLFNTTLLLISILSPGCNEYYPAVKDNYPGTE